MPRYKLLIEYDGTRYSGWQRQPNTPTVEQAVEDGLGRILQHEVDVIGQGRTDSGVHAEEQVAHFDVSDTLDEEKLLYGLLGVLPKDITAYALEKVEDDFHARFDAKARQYRYQLIGRPSALHRKWTCRVLGEFNPEVFKACAGMVQGVHDFARFAKKTGELPHTLCEVTVSEAWQEEGAMFCYRIRANRFLHNMVRRLVGSMLKVARGKEPMDYFREMLEHPYGKEGGHKAPAKGLILEKVFY